MKQKGIGKWLFVVLVILLAVSGIRPHDRLTWVLEICWVVAGLALVGFLAVRGIYPSKLLMWAMFAHSLILIYGGYYTYELAPLGEWMREAFGFGRNHYDRIGHFAQGFVPAILGRELLVRNGVLKNGWWRELFVFSMCMAFTAIFELIEFAAALTLGKDADAYLGSQGDIWDAQWDMFYCMVGTLLSIAIFQRLHTASLSGRLAGAAEAEMAGLQSQDWPKITS